MSMGWKRQYELDAVYTFEQAVEALASEKPNDAHLQDFARRCRLKTLTMLMQAQKETEATNVVRDRSNDCRACRQSCGNAKPCSKGQLCIYQRPEHQITVIAEHFGDEGLHFIEWAARIAKLREAKQCAV